MTNLLLFFKSLRNNRKPKSVNLSTGLRTELIPTTKRIKRIEVFGVKSIDPHGITLERLKDKQ